VAQANHLAILAMQANYTARNAQILAYESLIFPCWIHKWTWIELGSKLFRFEQMQFQF